MDNNLEKYDKVLDIIEHPDAYTSEELTELLSDPEMREIYKLLCIVDTAVEANNASEDSNSSSSGITYNKEVNVDEEWKAFSSKYPDDRRESFYDTENRTVGFGKGISGLARRFFGVGSRAASIAIIVFTSLVAVAAGIAVTVAVIDHKATPVANEIQKAAPLPVGMSVQRATADADSEEQDLTPVMFEDEPLEVIMNKIASVYGVDVKFNNQEVASLHLYYKLDPALPLQEVVEQLNTFEQINISQNGDTLTVD